MKGLTLRCKKGFIILTALLLSTIPTLSFAMGLGSVKVYSYLNDPLDAEIELLGMEDQEPDGIRVGLASNEDFEKSGTEISSVISQLKFGVEKVGNKMFASIKTDTPFKQPYLNIVVELSSLQGRILKTYSMLINPVPASGREKLGRANNPTAVSDTKSTNLHQFVTSPAVVAKMPNNKTLKSLKGNFKNNLQENLVITSKNIDENLRNLFEPDIKQEELVELPKIVGRMPVANDSVIESKVLPQSVPLIQTQEDIIDNSPTKLLQNVTDKETFKGMVWAGIATASLLVFSLFLITINLFKRKETIQFVVPGMSNSTGNKKSSKSNKPKAFVVQEKDRKKIIPTETFIKEMSLKLDLAKGYAHINDWDTAKELLEEVMAKGSDSDQREAQSIMAEFQA
ncbi:MAG: hypothetical protein JWM09_822 [Francisellaceae bacterium]|nr:hypothetical protein [Francisellaceae bacterium]